MKVKLQENFPVMVLLRHSITTYYSAIACYIAKLFHQMTLPKYSVFPYSAGSRIIGIGDNIKKNLEGQ
jgi:hypothetical protein